MELSSKKTLSGILYCLFYTVFPFHCWGARTVQAMSISISISHSPTDTAGCSDLQWRRETVAKLDVLI